jgi:hypothetical protein
MSALQLSESEYAPIMTPLLRARDYFKPNTEIGKQVGEAIQVLKARTKGKPSTMGGSSISKQDKIKDLFDSFGLTKRIGR